MQEFKPLTGLSLSCPGPANFLMSKVFKAEVVAKEYGSASMTMSSVRTDGSIGGRIINYATTCQKYKIETHKIK